MTQHHPALTAGGHRGRFLPNIWDVLAFAILFGLLAGVMHGGGETMAPLTDVVQTPISLDPRALPEYALRTLLRMLTALLASLLFSLAYATLAARSRRAEMVLIPLLDILQSVPVLGFLSFTVAGFMGLFPGRVLGVELAAVFAIFTSQAWNMTFSFYQSLKSLPSELDEAARSFRLTPWRRFWGLDVPFAVPGLVWNAMMSMSGGWFFVVAAEAISVGNTTISLPGIGSYVALAIEKRDLGAVGYALAAMLVVILACDQVMFRPLVAWAERFHAEAAPDGSLPRSWALRAIRRSRLFALAFSPIGRLGRLRLGRLPRFQRLSGAWQSRWADRAWLALLVFAGTYAALEAGSFVIAAVPPSEGLTVIGLGLLTMLRVVVLLALASLLWVPLGVMIGLRPRLAMRLQPLAQFLAAVPANIVFPFAVVLIARFDLNPDIWLSPLMILGTQWYILFNVIAGAAAFPRDLRDAAANFRVGGWRWWRKVMLPGIMPYYVTGAITAGGGSWNAAIVAEVASWGSTTLTAHGLGAYIAQATVAGDKARIMLGVAVMSLFVILFNRVLWRPLFDRANRFN
ncbi:ABC transporter permease [Zavarzinia sp.]|uniref:ABC transporter permease n=1 Tax=Zavarzinia sp. TaxID=2027920 RepID=UPI003568BE3D